MREGRERSGLGKGKGHSGEDGKERVGRPWKNLDSKPRGLFERLYRDQTYLLERSKGRVVESEVEGAQQCY